MKCKVSYKQLKDCFEDLKLTVKTKNVIRVVKLAVKKVIRDVKFVVKNVKTVS